MVLDRRRRIIPRRERRTGRPRKSSGRAASALLVDKGNYRHFMAKEIHEQPEVVGRTLAHYLDMSKGCVRLPFTLPFDAAKLERITIIACGTAYLAGLDGQILVRDASAALPVEVDVASEFRYREAPMPSGGLMIVVSQSGETADTLASLRYAKAHGQPILGVVNVPTSTMARESDVLAPTLAGPEIGVASTKAFTCQLAVLACLALGARAGAARWTPPRRRALVGELMALPGPDGRGAEARAQIEQLARILRQSAERALSRARHELSAGARGRAEAEGTHLHPRRGLRRGRTETWPDRADRRGHAGHRARTERSRCSKRPSRTCRRSRRAAAASS